MSKAAEVWLPIPSLGGRYQASSLGRIMGPQGRPLSLKKRPAGYTQFCISDGKGSSVNVSVARAVCEAFNGPPPPDSQCDHINHIRDDDQPSNLRWISRSANLARRKNNVGSEHPAARLTEDAGAAIRASSERSAVLAALYSVSARTIRDARSGKLWRHVNA